MENMTSPGTLLSGDNATWLEEYYQTWLRTPEQLPEDWRRFFLSPELTVQSVSGDNNVSGATLKKQAAVIQLINAWRTQGHLRAKLDPLGLNPPADVPSLQPGFWGLSEEDLLQEFSVTFGAHTTQMPLKQLLNLLEQAWAGSQAYELAHLENREEINWLLSRIESSNAPQADVQTCIARFEKLMAAETLERYLHTRYVGQKRFSLEGGESAIPALDTLTKRLRAQGVEEMVIGMAHRGRLNVLVNLLNKDPAQLFAEFEGKQTIGSGSGDVKYHMGYSSNLETPAGSLHVALAYKGAVLKAQVHAGGRGKAGGVKVLKQLPEAQAFVQQMLGSQLVTYQTGPEGQYVSSILLCENIYPVRQELYFGMVVDRESQRVTFIVSPEGGVEIEKVAHETPEKISSVSIDPLTGVQPCHIREMFAVLQLEHGLFATFSRLVNQAWKAFNELDFALLEINPLVLRETGEFMCADAKVSLDDNALYRHPELQVLRDETQEDPRESQAAKLDLNYVSLDGNIGCMVNGAGLAMATMDIIKLYGEQPANFLDVGGGATQERVSEAFRLIVSDSKVKAILVNIFGGIVRCDMIARAIIHALNEARITLPVVVRLSGNNAAEGQRLLAESGLTVEAVNSLDDAAKRIIALLN